MLNFLNKKSNVPSELLELEQLINSIRKKSKFYISVNELKGTPEYEQLKSLPLKEQRKFILKIISLIFFFSKEQAKEQKKLGRNYLHNSHSINNYGLNILLAVFTGLIRRKLNYNEIEWIDLFKAIRKGLDDLKPYKDFYFSLEHLPITYSIKQLEYHLKDNEPSNDLAQFINEIRNWDELKNQNINYYGGKLLKAKVRLDKLASSSDELRLFKLNTDDIGDAVNQIIDSIEESRNDFDKIFHLASAVSGSKPSKKFEQELSLNLNKIGKLKYKKQAIEILKIIISHKVKEISHVSDYGTWIEYSFLYSSSQQFIKGIVWTLNRFSDKETIAVLTKLCEKTYTKIPGKGPAAASVGNACVYVLGNMRGKDGLGALSRLKLKVRQNNVKKTIDKYLTLGAEKYKVSIEELKEMAVPDYKLVNGSKTVAFDDYLLSIFIEGRKVNQQWIKPDNSPMKSVPSIVKNSPALKKKLATVRKEVKEIQKVYSAQKQRIDNQFILDRTWDFASFSKYYLDHGLVFPITNKLIWVFSKNEISAKAILRDDDWYDLKGNKIDWIDETTKVQLWHPVNADENTIVAWREKIMELEWKQPIKQAFREIYILTEAELNTKSYSNRMAAHILKQHQFSSLANLRGWKYSLMGWYDDGRDNEVCKKYLPEHKITAEYWIDELNQDEAFNDTGIWHYVATDQVKFKNEQNEAMELVNVPKMVFTEIMRDVDLFVGVASVGNDPQWMDNNGERQTNRDYWQSYSFGDLSEIAKTRKAVLERLLPRLKKIRDIAHIDGKFLIVKGSLRTYKIHIGSTNILMEPNDQYLCIVPSRSADKSTSKIFIPFEGDRGLSIVLSKAFLLAEDDKIEDYSIVSQIK